MILKLYFETEITVKLQKRSRMLDKSCLVKDTKRCNWSKIRYFYQKRALFRQKNNFFLDLLFIDSGKIEYYNAKKDVLSLKKVFFAKKEVLLSRFCVTKEKTKQE